jgi:hypothetical protein
MFPYYSKLHSKNYAEALSEKIFTKTALAVNENIKVAYQRGKQNFNFVVSFVSYNKIVF